MIVGHIGGGAVGAGYQIEKSLRFRSTASAYLSRTVTQASSSQTSQHIRLCHKRGNLGAARTTLYYQGDSGGSGNMLIIEMVSDSLRVWLDGFGTYGLLTTAKYRDPSAHMDIYVGVDTGNATASDRLILVVNGVQVTGFQTASYPPLNFAINNGTGTVEYIGGFGASLNTDGYFSECFRADGASGISASSFGEFNADGVWVPKKYTGTYGTNGFYLPFNDGTNLTELCRDRSGNGNHWTANNISLTAGATYDWMDDTPTNNFATLNPLFMNPASISAGNLVVSGAVRAAATFGVTSGKWYWEAQTTNGNHYMASGLIKPGAALSEVLGYGDSLSWGWYASTGQKWFNGVNASWGSAFASTADRLVVAFDADNGELFFYKNGVLQGGGAAFTGLMSGPYFPALSITGDAANINCGQRPLTDTTLQATLESAGFKALCTKNRPLGGSITTSGSFTGNANADGPFVWLNGNPSTMAINGNAVTWGTHADKTAGGFKVRTNSASYNASGTNNYVVTITGNLFGDEIYAPNTAKGNP